MAKNLVSGTLAVNFVVNQVQFIQNPIEQHVLDTNAEKQLSWAATDV